MGIIITGAASGIGLASAHLLHSKGETVTLWDINEDALQATAKLLNVDYQVVDVRDYQQICEAMKQAIESMGHIRAVVHCAGIAHVGLFEDLSIEQHRQIIDVNLTGTINISHAAIPYLKQSQGSLILMASASSFYGPPDFASYGATKAAIVRFAEAIRLELERDRVHVGVIAPHFVETPMLDESKKSPMFEGASYTTTADEIAREIEKMIRLRNHVSVPGAINKLNYFLSRHLPELGSVIVRSIWQQGKKRRGRK